MAYTTIDNPELYFQVKTYTGNGTAIGSGGLANTFDGDENMQPDLVWIKARADTESHKLYDSVRGVTKDLESDLSTAENTNTEGLTTFGSDGFTIGNYSSINASTQTYVAWCWKESATAGFDIVAYTGNSTARTISHSLSAVPHMMIFRNRSNSTTAWNWGVYHQAIGNTHKLHLNDAEAKADNATVFNDTTPTSSVFSVGTWGGTNYNTDAIISYLWSEKQGFSKFGSFVGNGNASGPTIWTGMRVAWLMVRRSNSTGNWMVIDNKRVGYNDDNRDFKINNNDAERVVDQADLLSNGFKVRTTSTDWNTSGGTYIYMAFAEAPFVNSNGVPCNAR